MKLFISTPCYGGHCTKQYAGSILKLQTEARKRNINIQLDTTENESLITRARNMSVARFLTTDCPYLLFIDADINFQPEAVLQAIDADEDVVVSPYPKKRIVWEQGEDEVNQGGTKSLDRVTSDLVINVKTSNRDHHEGTVRRCVGWRYRIHVDKTPSPFGHDQGLPRTRMYE